MVKSIGRLLREADKPASQFRFLIDEVNLKAQIVRNGLGWGPNVTVASVIFNDEIDFQSFLQAPLFSGYVKQLLVKSLLSQKQVIFGSDGKANLHLRASINFV